MDFGFLERWLQLLLEVELLTSPLVFAGLSAVAVMFLWAALAPTRSEAQEEGRLEGYLDSRRDIIEDMEMERSFIKRVLLPAVHRILKLAGSLTPWHDVERLQRSLVLAGDPGGLTAPDVLGLQILSALVLAGLYLLLLRVTGTFGSTAPLVIVRNGGVLAIIGYLLPRLWLHMAVDNRKRDIIRHFPDALDLLSVSVDAGLALDSAMVRVCERWRNALTDEMNRAILEIRVGTPRNTALERMAARTGVPELETFVGVLVQSSELGVSIAETLHAQAAQVRVARRQRAEELARQASVKMVFALVFLIFPALLVVLLGPGIPRIVEALGGAMGGG